MKVKQYKVTAPGYKNAMIATYTDGILSALEGIQEMARMWEDIAINAPVPINEKEIPAKKQHFEGLVSIEPCQYDTPGEKISLFCRLYKHYRGSSYTVFPADSRFIDRIPVSEELLQAYFTNTEWWGRQPKSIRNYATNINELRQLIKPKEEKPAKKTKKKFPNDWDKQYENTLNPTELQQYWAHLREQGLKPVREQGIVVKWAKAVATAILLLLLSGCMTPNRVASYIQKNPNAVELQYDTVYQHHIFHDTIYLPIDSFIQEWEWSLGGGADTSFSHQDKTFFITRVQVDTVFRYRLRAVTAPDTLILRDTVRLSCPSGTATIAAPPCRLPWWLWALAIVLSLLIIIVWLRKR